MARIFTSAEQLIGHTPLLELKGLEGALELNARLLAKLEYANPGGSIKDRVALNMIDDAEKRGL
ncbi:MAG: pyridoxal-phosphate dependent enzyme, partial [Clostridia bacterium]|nr:pyridoxal-phosphate dependent enzyme [Clostridia bacterium]